MCNLLLTNLASCFVSLKSLPCSSFKNPKCCHTADVLFGGVAILERVVDDCEIEDAILNQVGILRNNAIAC